VYKKNTHTKHTHTHTHTRAIQVYYVHAHTWHSSILCTRFAPIFFIVFYKSFRRRGLVRRTCRTRAASDWHHLLSMSTIRLPRATPSTPSPPPSTLSPPPSTRLLPRGWIGLPQSAALAKGKKKEGEGGGGGRGRLACRRAQHCVKQLASALSLVALCCLSRYTAVVCFQV
jgi:hypothetical protein